jgi:biofilm PGA synthesis N-glycosyltransferase PgaC
MKTNELSYVIVSPVRNEEDYISLTLDSVISQTIQPRLWVIVDDGSSDNTNRIVRSYLEENPWIKLLEFNKEGPRKRGGRIVDVFNAGLKFVNEDFNFIAKLDGDLSFAADYFEKLIIKFHENPRLGIVGGECYILAKKNKKWKLEVTPPDHVRGPTKFYRKECFDDINGLTPVNGWDSIDEWRAQMKGWETRGYSEIKVYHHRPTGATEGWLGGYVRQGEFAYFLGYPWIAILARGLYRAYKESPLILAGFSIIWGYLSSWWKNQPKFDDQEMMAYVRKKQYRRLAFWR